MYDQESRCLNHTAHYTCVNGWVLPTTIASRSVRMFQMLYGPLTGKLQAGAIVLGIGCGSGVLLGWLSRQSYVVAMGVNSSTSQLVGRDPRHSTRLADAIAKLNRHLFRIETASMNIERVYRTCISHSLKARVSTSLFLASG